VTRWKRRDKDMSRACDARVGIDVFTGVSVKFPAVNFL